jgi:type VI secretion system ImpM family protein
MAATSTTLGVFGYLPGQSDFVRVRAADREVRRFEEWLERGLHQARWEMGGGFSVAYPRLFHRFVFRLDNSERVVVGVLCASVDSHQRPFPFVAFDLVPIEAWDRDPAAFVSRNGGFFATLEQLIRAVGPLAHIGQIHGLVAGTQAAVQLHDASANLGEHFANDEARYENFLHETVCADLAAPGLPSVAALSHGLFATLGGRQDPRLLRQALALPLYRPLFSRDLELRFYLSFLSTLLAMHRPTWTLFWQLGGTLPGKLVLSFREPSLDVFSALLCNEQGARGVSCLGAAPMQMLRPIPGLTDQTSLHNLLQVISAKQPVSDRVSRKQSRGRS